MILTQIRHNGTDIFEGRDETKFTRRNAQGMKQVCGVAIAGRRARSSDDRAMVPIVVVNAER